MVGDFEPWYRQEHPRVLAACLALSSDLAIATEATDEALTIALERWPRVRLMSAPGAWTQTVALNRVRRLLRRQRFERLIPGARPSVHEPVELADEDLWAAVRALPSRQRRAVLLRYVADLPEADIATAMGVTRGTIASTLHDARQRLRAAIGETQRPEFEDEHEETVDD